MIQTILFDFNGIIIDDEPLHFRAYQNVLKEENVPLTESEYYQSLGMDDETLVRTVFERAGRSLDEATMRSIIEREAAAHRELIGDNPPLFPGVVTFVKAAARHFTLGLVSMARKSEIDYVLESAALKDAFSVIVSAEDVSECKPHPECYNRAFLLADNARRAARHFSMTPEECLVVEDSPPGIESARRAGMRTLGVTNTVTEAALRAAGADIVTRNLADWTTDAVHHVFD